jgi:tetratricopeptide (TPR) repeat protein
MQRTVEVHIGRLMHIILVPWKAFQHAFRRIAGRLVAIERRYHREHARDVQISPEDLQSMLAEAERALREERFQSAEERLVELVSASPKFAPAYEVFSRLYAAKREWKEAVESLIFYVKLAPQDGDRRFLLGAMYEKQGEREKAFVEYEHALNSSPHNPKYLNAGIVLAIDLKKRDIARKMLDALREANPENANIEIFDRQILELVPVSEPLTSLPEKKRKNGAK